MEEIKFVKLKESTKRDLDDVKIIPRESYNDAIQRLIDNYKKNKEIVSSIS